MFLRPPLLVLALAVTALGALAGCTAVPAAHTQPVPVVLTHSEAGTTSTTTPELPQQLPGLGPLTLAQVPADANQVVEVTGAGVNSSSSTVVIYQRTTAGWQAGAS
jgi:hypothetical protein